MCLRYEAIALRYVIALLNGTGKSELYVYAVKTEDLRPPSLQFIVIMHFCLYLIHLYASKLSIYLS